MYKDKLTKVKYWILAKNWYYKLSSWYDDTKVDFNKYATSLIAIISGYIVAKSYVCFM